VKSRTVDSFQNFTFNLGIGTDNPSSDATYGFNPITRNRTLLEWIHRGSWIGGVAVDLVGDDMTRAGVDFVSTMKPDSAEQLQSALMRLGIWESTNECVKWARLYGGCIAVALIDGQDTSTPLRIDTVGKGQFKGLLVLDRWMVEPTLEDLVTDFGPSLGQPKFYKVNVGAQALRNNKVHYSRCIRMDGIRLPYWQRVMENLWGLSVLERLYDRLIAFDSATQGAAQLVYKSYLRTIKVKDLREAIAAGTEAMGGVSRYFDMMRRFQGIEGLTLIDAEDDFTATTHSAFGGLSDALVQFGQQLSGALQIPLVRLFGQSPAGLNASGDSDLRTYYDGIKQAQERSLRVPFDWVFRVAARSEGIPLPENFNFEFKSLYQLTPEQKAQVATARGGIILQAAQDAVIPRSTALKELRQVGRETGTFTNITDEDIEAAEDEPLPGSIEAMQQQQEIFGDPQLGVNEPQKGMGEDLPGEGEQRSQQPALRRVV
jgi:phage-related protein (TIGR01555 family)